MSESFHSPTGLFGVQGVWDSDILQRMHNESEVLGKLQQWATDNDVIRAMILTSSRANPHANPDVFSDYDIALYVSDITPFMNDDWVSEFGTVMTCWPKKPMTTWSDDWITRLILFEDELRIDFQITEKKSIEPNEYANGYKVLIDKDGITKGMNEPTYDQYITQAPSEDEFDTLVREFFWEITYIAKSLWRDELYFAKFFLDSGIRFGHLKKMIEWYIGSQNNWSVNTNINGRYFKSFLSPEDWNELETTYAGPDIEENWEAFFNMVTFFRRLAKTVAKELGYTYPDDLDAKVSAYCRNAKTKK